MDDETKRLIAEATGPLLAKVAEAVELGQKQAQEWDRFWEAMGVKSADITVDQAIEKWREMRKQLDEAHQKRELLRSDLCKASNDLAKLMGPKRGYGDLFSMLEALPKWVEEQTGPLLERIKWWSDSVAYIVEAFQPEGNYWEWRGEGAWPNWGQDTLSGPASPDPSADFLAGAKEDTKRLDFLNRWLDGKGNAVRIVFEHDPANGQQEDIRVVIDKARRDEGTALEAKREPEENRDGA